VNEAVPAPAVPAVRAFPVSVKGVAVQDGRVLLLENEWVEWELPGGKLELGETRLTAWSARSSKRPAGR
jgi:8-oxo-dGTP pyrophosphatase MutT (NUDIX family)